MKKIDDIRIILYDEKNINNFIAKKFLKINNKKHIEFRDEIDFGRDKFRM